MSGASDFSLRSPVSMPTSLSPNSSQNSWYFEFVSAFRGLVYQARWPAAALKGVVLSAMGLAFARGVVAGRAFVFAPPAAAASTLASARARHGQRLYPSGFVKSARVMVTFV